MPEHREQAWQGTLHPLQDASLPERVDEFIVKGIRKGKALRERRRRAVRRGIGSGIAVAVLLVTCVLSVRVSPAFASMLKEIPGLDTFVKLIDRTSDQGIRLAVKNDFYQAVDASDEHNGVKFDVEGIIVDETRMVMFYSLYSNSPVQLGRPEVMNGQLQSLGAVVSWGHPAEDLQGQKQKQEPGVRRGTIDIQLQEGLQMPDEVVFRIDLSSEGQTGPAVKEARAGQDLMAAEAGAEKPGDAFTVRIPIDRAKFAALKEEIALNRSFKAEGQTITFVKATVSPLRIGVEIAYDANNSKQIFGAGDIRLVDEQGTEWRSLGGSHPGADHEIVYFESSYFRQPKELYVEGSLFRALDKDQRSIVIDTERKRLLEAPDEKVKLMELTDHGDYSTIVITLNGLAKDDHMGYSILDTLFTDADGKSYSLGDVQGTSVSMDADSGNQTSYYRLPKGTYKQPLTFHVVNYPGYIRHPYRIRLK